MKNSIVLIAVAGALSFSLKPACAADDAALPGAGFTPSHYETLWTKSPFSVATAEAVEESPDYSLVGITQLEGVSYASVIERQTQDHFLISSEKPTKGLILKSITRGHNGDTFAAVEKDGQPLSLKLESAPAGPAAAPGMPGAPGEPPAANAPPIMVPPITQNIPMPGSNMQPASVPGANPSTRFIRIHRPTIHLPPMPGAQGGANGTPVANPAPPPPNTADGVQPHTPPPAQ